MKTVYYLVLLFFCTLIFSNFANPLIEMHDEIGFDFFSYEGQPPNSNDGLTPGHGKAFVPIPKTILLLCTGLVFMVTIRRNITK